MRHCRRCGKELRDDAVMCFGCGLVGDEPTFNAELNDNQKFTLNTLYEKMASAAKFWRGVSIFQFIGAAVYFILMLFVDFAFITNTLALAIIGALNWRASSTELEFLENIKKKPVGIIAHFESITNILVAFIYNLVFGGIIGVIGSVLDYLTRNYVINNKAAFAEIEATENRQGTPTPNQNTNGKGTSDFDAFGQR